MLLHCKHGFLSVDSVLLELKSRVYLNSPKDATTDPVIKRPKDVSWEKFDCHKRLKVSRNMKLIYPLDFQLRVSASILVDVSLPFAFQRQRFLALSFI